MQEILVVYKKLDKYKRKKLIKSTISYIFKVTFLLCCFINICYETVPATSNNTRTLIGKVNSIETIENNRMYDVIKITINDETFPFVWDSLKNRAEALDLLTYSDIVSVTVKKDRWLFSLKAKYVERVVDIRIGNKILYDIEYNNKMNVVYFTIPTIGIALFWALFTFWYYLNIKFFVDKVIMKKSKKKRKSKERRPKNTGDG